MAAPVATSKVLLNTPKRLVIKCLALFSDTDETNVVKVDKSAYTGPNGLEPSYFLIEKIIYDMAGGYCLSISSDHTTDEVLFRIQGTGGSHLDYREVGGISTNGAGGTGDILFTTNGATTANDSYDVTLFLKKID